MEVSVNFTFEEIDRYLTNEDYHKYFIAYPDIEDKSRKEIGHRELVNYMEENNFTRVDGYEESQYGGEFWNLVLEKFHKEDD